MDPAAEPDPRFKNGERLAEQGMNLAMQRYLSDRTDGFQQSAIGVLHKGMSKRPYQVALAADQTQGPGASKTPYLVHQDDERRDSGLLSVAFLDDGSDSIAFGGSANGFKPTNKAPPFTLDRNQNPPVTQQQVEFLEWFQDRIDENAMRVVSDAVQQAEVIERIGAIERLSNETNAKCEKMREKLTRGLQEVNGVLDRMQRRMADDMAALDER
jgi:hypothetical protein